MPDRRKNDLEQRIASIETAINAQGGVLDRLRHLDTCIDGLKNTIAQATGGIKAAIWTATALLSGFVTLATWYFSR